MAVTSTEAQKTQFISIAEAATLLGVSRWTVGRMLADGEFPFISPRGVPRIDRADLKAWIIAQKVSSMERARSRTVKPVPVPQSGKRPVGAPRKAGLSCGKASAYLTDDI